MQGWKLGTLTALMSVVLERDETLVMNQESEPSIEKKMQLHRMLWQKWCLKNLSQGTLSLKASAGPFCCAPRAPPSLVA